MRLLLVDDEELVVDGLYEIFYYETDYEIYKAYSAEEAIQLLGTMRFDVVVSDIQMPGMDGIELSEEIFLRWPWCRIVFLTGHSEFEYVYKAIQRPNVQFLLKTEDTDRLLEVVDLAVHYIMEEDTAKKLYKQAEEQILRAKEMFQNDYLDRVLSGRVVPQALELTKLGVNVNIEHSVFLVAGSMGLEENDSYYERIEKIQSIKSMIFRKLAMKVRVNIVTDQNFYLTLLVQPDNHNHFYQQLMVFLAGTIETVQNACKENLKVDVSFVTSDLPVEWEDLPKKVRQMRIELNKSIGSTDQVLLSEEGREVSVSQAQGNIQAVSFLKEKFRKFETEKVTRFLEIGKKEDFFKEIEPILNALKEVNTQDDPTAQEVFLTVSALYMNHINKYDLIKGLLEEHDQRKLGNIYEHDSYCCVAAFLMDIGERIFRNRMLRQRSHSEEIVHMVENHIRENLHDDLSLVALGKKVYLNPAYLSRLYKQVRNSNLSAFIDKERIYRARELLKDKDRRIVDIAENVGYENAASFTRRFKKMTGITPQEFRTL